MVLYCLGNLYDFNEASTSEGTESCAINMKLEAEAADRLDDSRLQAIELCHSFDLTKTYVVAILI